MSTRPATSGPVRTGPSGTVLIRADDVGVRHQGHAGFTPAAVSLTLSAGEVVLLLGPSGCGKSTFALTLNGLVPQSVPAELRGAVVVGPDHLDATTTPVGRLAEHVAMVFQDPDASVVTGSVLDEVCFGPENLLLAPDEILRRAEDALRRVGLWERRDDDPGILSGGGRQRLAVACALAQASPVLVLDEPTANLDPAGIEEFYATLTEVVADGDRAVLLVEHNLDACADLVTRVVALDRRGRVVLDGPARDILAGHADELAELGVWLPTATLAGRRLRDAGVLPPSSPLPLTPGELNALLTGEDADPEPWSETSSAPAAGIAGTPEPDAAPPVVQVDDLVVRRGGHGLTRRRREATGTVVLDRVSLRVRAGELHAVVGVNGAGKSTLLRAIAGVEPPPPGAVRVAGLDPARADLRDLASRVGYVFQNPEHQFVRHTVAEELAHALELRGLDRAGTDARVDDMLGRFGLRTHRAAHPFLLSGGQKRRLSVGTALIGGARILVLDEPTFGQDRERAAELLTLLDDLVAAGTAVVVATHDLQLVAEHATHVLVLAGGRVAAHGPAAQVIASGTLDDAGLRRPPLAEALHGTRWSGVTRLADLPGPDPAGHTEPDATALADPGTAGPPTAGVATLPEPDAARHPNPGARA
ncbi:ABC transporter ATP-binding protein [Myceligenerans crystallogenes]|uniref:ABC transporter ATP-binding protein n=1 Tax=Myceligenerans crystallogenes TaxID=316335 RepID=A0ABN2NLU0_9MICO